MHGQLGSGARFLNCHVIVHLDPFFVCTSSEDSDQYAHVCRCAHMCIHSLCVRAVKTLASLRMRAHLHGPSLWKLQ